MTQPRILFTSPWGNYPKVRTDDDPIDYFYYRNTYRQKIFQLRSHQSWHSLHLIAQNLSVQSIVLENPTQRNFKRELNTGMYSIVAIGFTVLLSPKVFEMVKWIKEKHPGILVILGGYGTAIFKENLEISEKIKPFTDGICFGDGISFFRELLEEKWSISNTIPLHQNLLPASNSIFRTRIKLFEQIIMVGGLGCTYGCAFCATSSQFNRKYHSLFNGKELVKALIEQSKLHPNIQSAIIYEEDFLLNHAKVSEFMHHFEKSELSRKPFLITIFASTRSILNYSVEELIRCGIGTIFIGVESLSDEVLRIEHLKKREGNIEALFKNLHRHGINTLGSLVLGWDEQTPDLLQADIERFVALNPTFYQVVPLHLVPGTSLWEKLRKQGRISSNYCVENDGINKVNFTPEHFTETQLTHLALGTYQKLVDEGGAWPFRLLENLTNGFQELQRHSNPIFINRATLYRKMIPPLLLLASASRFMFFGRGFRARCKETYGQLYKTFPAITLTSMVVAPFIAIAFYLIYLFSNLIFWMNPSGGQPNRTRTEYPS